MKKIVELLNASESSLLEEWIALQVEEGEAGLVPQEELEEQSKDFVKAFRQAVKSEKDDLEDDAWDETLSLLREIALARGQRGLSPMDTATFVLSLKEVLFGRLLAEGAGSLLKELWTVTTLIDKLGLYVMSIFIERREDVIERQQEEMLEISTPVVELWDGIVALPVIGTLDSSRAQVVMEGLLQAIVDYEASIAIIDITGVPAVDTQTAQHLLKTVTAAELMGAECFVSGVRPQIAQTIVHLGLDLKGMQTKASLVSAFQQALRRKHLKVVNVEA